MGYGAIAGGVLGAAGSILGPLLAPSDKATPKVSTTSPQSNPLISAGGILSALSTGFFDPSMLMGSSPLEQAIAAVKAQPMKSSKQIKLVKALNDAILWVQTGGVNFPGEGHPEWDQLEKALAIAGYTNMDAFVSAQSAFQQRADQLAQTFAPINELGLQSSLGALTTRANIIANLPTFGAADLEQAKQAELDRLTRDINKQIGEQRTDLLKLANASGINPTGALGDISEYQFNALQDADMTALNRALALLGGENTLARNQLSLTDTALAGPLQNLATFGGLATGQQTSVIPAASFGPQSLLPLGIQGATNALTSPEFTNALGQLFSSQSQSPAYTPSNQQLNTYTDLSGYEGYGP